MNRKYIVSIGVVVSMMSSIASAGFVNDGFTGANGTALNGRDQWGATHATSVMISNNAAAIPILQTLSNNVAPLSDTKVWTDFMTIPRPFVSAVDAAPAVDPNSSAMFFVTNTRWAVVCGAGGSTTNVYTTDVFGDSVRNVVNDGSTWYQVSVFHNYGATNWSFFVDGKPVMTNMAFISNVPNYQWFSVQNGGGNVSNVTWIDDVLITNRVPSSLTNDHDGKGVRDAWELMYYGTIGVVSPTNDADGDGFDNSQESILGGNPTVQSPGEPGGSNMMEYVFNAQNAGIVSLGVTNGSSMKLGFVVGADRVYRVLFASTVNGPYTEVGQFYTGPSGLTDWYVDPSALANSRGYYRLAATNGPIAETNELTYSFYQQSRTIQSGASNFWTGIMVNYGAGNKLSSTLGDQLMIGLKGGSETTGDRLTIYSPSPSKSVFFLNGERQWEESSGSLTVDSEIPVGTAMLIKRMTSGPDPDERTSAVLSGALITNNTPVSIQVNAGWNMLCWPYQGSSTVASAVADINQPGDVIWIYRNGQYKQLRRISDEWKLSGGGTLSGSPWGYVQFGEGFFYTNSADRGTWSP